MIHSLKYSLPVLALLLLSGCGSLDIFKPRLDTSRHYLFESQITPAENAALNENGPVIMIGPASAARQLDPSRIAFRTDSNTVRYSNTNRWAAPLVDNINRVLMDRLAREMDTSRVGTMRSMGNIAWDYQVAYHVGELSGKPGESIRFAVSWWIARPDSEEPVYRNSVIDQPIDAEPGDFDAYVRAMRSAIDSWADEVVRQLMASKVP